MATKVATRFSERDDDRRDVLLLPSRVPCSLPPPSLPALPPSTNCPAAFRELYARSFHHATATTAASSSASVDRLPPIVSDVVPRVLSFLDARSLSRASCVSKSWSMAGRANDLWTVLCVATFGVAPWELRPAPDPTRALYVLSHMRMREALRGCTGGGVTGSVQTLPAAAFRGFGR